MQFRSPEPQITVVKEIAPNDPRVAALEQVLEKAQSDLRGMQERFAQEKDQVAASGEERELWVASQGMALQKQTRELEYLRAKNARLDTDLKDLVRRYTVAMDELQGRRGTVAVGIPVEPPAGQTTPLVVSTGPGYAPPYRPPVRSTP